MDISVHALPEAHPVKTGWVDDALSGAYAAGDPLGALVGRPLATGDGIMLVGWATGTDDRYHVFDAHTGPGTGPAAYMQIVTFDGPRTDEWVAAEERAATERIAPAAGQVPGIVQVLRLRAADNGYIVVTLAETADAIDDAVRAIMSTTLLPGEDADRLTGPDRVGLYRLMHADLPTDISTGRPS